VARTRADNPGLDVYRAVECWVKANAGLHDEVRAQLDREVTDDFPAYEDQHWLTAHALWAYAAALSGHRDAAVIMRARLAPWHQQCTTTHITFGGVVAQYLGMVDHALGDLDRANDWYGEALTLHERLASPVLVAWTKVAWASLLSDRDRQGDLERARRMLEEAIGEARANGWGFIEQAASHIDDRGRRRRPANSTLCDPSRGQP
jgi:ATP/maltotriose-dependent transcriptional regulator MalT